MNLSVDNASHLGLTRLFLPRWGYILGLLLIGVAAALARFYQLGEGLLSNDECFSWRLIQYSPADLIRHTAADTHPPLSYLLLQGWTAFWGDSPIALRTLSVILSLLCISILYLLCLEACGTRPGMEVQLHVIRLGALLAAFLMAVHVAQVIPSRTARMYPLGCLLAGLTAWFLLRALRGRQGAFLWWTAYGLSVAAFCYTHYYAFFTVAAQTVFVAGDLLREARTTSLRDAAVRGQGFLYAGVLAALLFSPWLPALSVQLKNVHQTFWIRPLTLEGTERVFFTWGTGLDYQGPLLSGLWIVLLCVALGITAWRADRAGWFFLTQALLPWLLALGFSLLSGRPLLLLRYLTFAQLSLLGFWGVVCWRLPGWPERALLAAAVSIPALVGLGVELSALPTKPPPLASAAEFLRAQHKRGDLVLVAGPPAVNRLRYYAKQAGIDNLDVRCRVNLFTHDLHMSHAAALQTRDIFWPEEMSGGTAPSRVWWGAASRGGVGEAWPGMRRVLERTFEDGRGAYTLVLLEREP